MGKSQETFPCPVVGCGKVLKQGKSLAKHLETHEERENRAVFPCDECDKHYLSDKALQQHKKDIHGTLVIHDEDKEPNKAFVPITVVTVPITGGGDSPYHTPDTDRLGDSGGGGGGDSPYHTPQWAVRPHKTAHCAPLTPTDWEKTMLSVSSCCFCSR